MQRRMPDDGGSFGPSVVMAGREVLLLSRLERRSSFTHTEGVTQPPPREFGVLLSETEQILRLNVVTQLHGNGESGDAMLLDAGRR